MKYLTWLLVGFLALAACGGSSSNLDSSAPGPSDSSLPTATNLSGPTAVEEMAPVIVNGLITPQIDAIDGDRSYTRDIKAHYDAFVLEDSSLLPLNPTLLLDGEPIGGAVSAHPISWHTDEPMPLCELDDLREFCQVGFSLDLADLEPGEHSIEFAATDAAGTLYTSSPIVFAMPELVTFELLERDYEEGILSVDQYSMLGLIWVLDPSQLPVRYRDEYWGLPPGDGVEDSATGLLWEYDGIAVDPEIIEAIRRAWDLAHELDYEGAAALLLETYVSTGGPVD